MTDNWREMDSVPKDGSFVLLCNVHHGRVVVAAWATVDRIREDMPWWEDGDGGWIDREAGNPEPITAYYNPLYFQAWQSLPEPRRLERQPFDLERFLQDDSNLPA